MKPSSTGDKYYDLWILFRNANDTVLRARFKELNQLGVLGSQAALLLIVQMIEADGGQPTAAEIARRLFRKPHTISSTLDRMEKEGLVKKVRDLERKNQLRVTITEKGREYYQKSAQRESIHRILAFLSAAERRQLKSILEKLLSEACKELGVQPNLPWP